MELELNTETVLKIIDKTHQFHMKETVTLSDEPTELGPDAATGMLADHVDDPTYHELKYIIDDLEPDQQQMLVALMWLGRGDFDMDEWSGALAHAADSWTTRTADYLIGTPMAADYLSEGLELFSATIR